MRNHYHFLLETKRATLVRGMQYLNSTYARRYNVRHKTFGHLFQGRYKALLVDGEAKGYFLTVSDYIHMNPVRAGLVRDGKELFRDRWSSAGWLAGVRKAKPDWLEWSRVYSELGLRDYRRKQRREYREYLERRVGEEKPDDPRWKKIQRGWCYGGKDFVEKMRERLEELSRKEVKYDTWNDEAGDELEEIRAERDLEDGMQRLGYEKLQEMERWDRYLLAEWVRTRNRVKMNWLGAMVGNHNPGSFSGSLFQLRQKRFKDQILMKKWRKLCKN